MARAAIRAALAGAVVFVGGVAPAQEPVLPSPRPVMAELVGPFYGEFRYAASGEPYPWWQNHPGWVTPMAGNPATFGGPSPAPLVVVVPAPAVAPARGWERMPYAEK